MGSKEELLELLVLPLACFETMHILFHSTDLYWAPLWVELCPSSGYVEVLTPGPCEFGLIWIEGFCPLKMKSG